MATRSLYLVRHGQYEDVSTPPAEEDGPLAATGREQARLTARRLQAFPLQVIHHSDLQRARETAAIIADQFPGLPLRASPLLRECIPHVPERAALSPSFRRLFARLPGEVLEQGRAQAEAAFAAYFKPARGTDRHELVVSSGNLIRYFMCRVLGAPPGAWWKAD